MLQGKINIDNSNLTPIAECTTKAALTALDLGGRSDSRDAMDAGSVMHDGLHKHYLGGTRDESFAALDKSYDEYFPAEKPAEEDRLSRGNLQDIFGVFVSRHAVDREPFEVLEAEQIVGCPLDDAGDIIIWAKRDLLVKDKATRIILPLDHKSTGAVNFRWQNGWQLASQLAGYTWLTAKQTKGICTGCYVNAIEMRMLPTSTRRCPTHKMPYNECRLEHAVIKLLFYEYTQDMQDAWRSTAIMLTKRLQKIKKWYPTIEMVSYAPTEGMFNRSCAFCGFKKYCRAGRPAHAVDQFLQYNHFAPWESEERVFFDWR